MYGQVDQALRYGTNDDAAGNSTWRMGSGGLYSSRIGFKGEESLGGNSAVFFQLESGFRTDTGALGAQSPGSKDTILFGRLAQVGMRGDWGQLSAGRQYNALTSIYDFLPMGDQLYLGGDHFFGGYRLNNSLIYKKKLGDWSMQMDWGLGEQAGSASRKSMIAASLGYKKGPFQGSVAMMQNRSQDGATTGRNGNIGAGWEITPEMRLSGGYARNWESGGTQRQRDIAFVSLRQKLTPQWTVYGNYYTYRQSACSGRCEKRPGDPDNVTGGIDNSFTGYAISTTAGRARLLELIATYDLSKRTTLYATSNWMSARDGAAQDHLYTAGLPTAGRNRVSQSHFVVGMRHAF